MYNPMYKSPIEVSIEKITAEMRQTEHDYMMKCVKDVGINVDYRELQRALAYDRDQYEKGYNDGIKMVDYICKWLSDNFDPPCAYTFRSYDFDVAEFMNEDGFCADDCEKDNSYCWKHFFEKLIRWEHEQDRNKRSD